MSHICFCGSGEPKYPLKDGYGIFLTYVCDKCVKQKRSEFRVDIFEQYETDEQIDAE
jgi:hypothetical protein